MQKYVGGVGVVELTPEEETAVLAEWAGYDPVASARTTAALSRMAFMLALDGAGLLTQAETMMADPLTDRRIRLMWENATSFDRLHPDLVQMGYAMGLSDAQMDAVFGIVV